MIIPEKLKLNKFKLVSIPKNRDYFARYGQGITPESAFSGEDSPVPTGESKLAMMDRVMREYDKKMQEEVIRTEQKNKDGGLLTSTL